MKNILSVAKVKLNKKEKKYSSEYKGKMVLMCPVCHDINIVKVHNKLNYQYKIYDKENVDNYNNIFLANSFKGYCKKCEVFVAYIELDGHIGRAIQILNEKCYITNFCCEGHDYEKGYAESIAYIFFDCTDYLKPIKEHLPDTWYIDQNDLKQGKLVIRAKENVSLEKRMKDIRKMAEDLPVY